MDDQFIMVSSVEITRKKFKSPEFRLRLTGLTVRCGGVGQKEHLAPGCRYADYIALLAMSNHDLELGILSPESILQKVNQEIGDAGHLESSWHPLEPSRVEEVDSQTRRVFGGSLTARRAPTLENEGRLDSTQDERIVGVSRKKVEQLVRLWIEVLQESLTDKTSRESRQPTATPLHEDSSQAGDSLPLVSPLNTSKPQPLKADVRAPQPEGWISIGKHDQVIRHNVQVWTESEIMTEDESRRAVRQEWRTTGDYTYLEDCWEHLWQPKPGVDKGLFQWSCSDERRKGLQLDLADALNANNSIIVVGLYIRRDFRAIAPWISLIGLRLNELYRTIYQGAGISPMTQIEILIECIWCCNLFQTKLGDKQNNQSPRVGDVLSACYRPRILEQPTRNPLLDGIILREHYQHVRTALYLINLLYRHTLPTFHRSENLDVTWETSLSTAEATMRENPNGSELETGKDSFFRVDDFNVRDLQSLGHLQLQWTTYWDEHLKLETSSTANIIKVYWFQPSLAQFLVQK